MKQMLFVFNPRSGKEQIRGSLLRILDIFTKDGYDIHVHVTQSQGDASRIVKELGEGMDLILCSGGDGTLNETICGMLALKDQPPVGVYSCGFYQCILQSAFRSRRIWSGLLLML